MSQSRVSFEMDTALATQYDLVELRSQVRQLDQKVAVETRLREELQLQFQECMNRSDWTAYTQELTTACGEIKVWRSDIQAERETFRETLMADVSNETAKCFDPLIAEMKQNVTEGVETLTAEMKQLWAALEAAKEGEDGSEHLESLGTSPLKALRLTSASLSTTSDSSTTACKKRLSVAESVNSQQEIIKAFDEQLGTQRMELSSFRSDLERQEHDRTRAVSTMVELKACVTELRSSVDRSVERLTAVERSGDDMSRVCNLMKGAHEGGLLGDLAGQMSDIRQALVLECEERSLDMSELSTKLEQAAKAACSKFEQEDLLSELVSQVDQLSIRLDESTLVHNQISQYAQARGYSSARMANGSLVAEELGTGPAARSRQWMALPKSGDNISA